MANLTAVAPTDFGNVLRAAYQAHSNHPETVRRLARYLFSTDALEELMQLLGATVHDTHADPECLHFLGTAALALGHNALAESALSRAVSGGYGESLGHWAKALNVLNKPAEAYSVGMRALENSPDDDVASHVIFSMLLADRRYAEVWNLCLRLRAAGRWTARIISAMALAAQTPDQIALIRQITDPELWLEQATLGLDQSFNTELGRHLKEMKIWTPLPRTKATAGTGERIEKIHTFAGSTLLSKLFAHIQTAITNYVDKRAVLFAPSASEPMKDMRPDYPALRSWAITVNMDGHEEWHVHPDGWLSGVFYVEVPDLSASHAPHAGRIEFGPLPLGSPANDTVWPKRLVQPRTGDLLLFPSYIAHRTWPTQVRQDRICISFDVLRRGLESPVTTPEADRSHSNIAPDRLLIRHERSVCATGDAGFQVGMNVDSGTYLAMDEISALLWKFLKHPHTTRDLAHFLLREFDGTEADIMNDISNALRVMVTCGLVAVV
jgi:uncharacterized protein (TIGR02466 family)